MEDNNFRKIIKNWEYTISPIFQWKELFSYKEYNWIDFSPIEMKFECGKYRGKYFQITFIIMGIGFWFDGYDIKSRKELIDSLTEKLDLDNPFADVPVNPEL